MESLGTFDYVVVGAGSAGCVVAARLSESGAHSVAVLEAGGEDNHFWIHAPLGYGKLYDDPRYNWMYEGEPEPGLANHPSYQPRGKVLGGTGSINGMIYMRGCREDFDHWRQLGNTGWAYDDVLPFFRVGEDYAGGASEYHGAGGCLGVTDAPRHELADAFVRAGVQAGFETNPDFNGSRIDGFGYNQVTIRDGRRASSAVAYLRPARRRANLKLVLNALARQILVREDRATGVAFERDGVRQTVTARREVILCGGAFNSPQLLQLSGIGPAGLLGEHGIPVVNDLPGVGENLQDHFVVTLGYRSARPITVNDVVNNPLKRTAMGLRYLLFHTGLLATIAVPVGGCIQTDPALSAPDVKVNLHLWHRADAGRSKGGISLAPFSSFGTSVLLLRPASRGKVRIRSNDSAVAPRIQFNLFVSDTDHRAAIAGLRTTRRIMSMPAIAPYVEEELSPGPTIVSDEELLGFCRKFGRSSHHPSSTCKMGVDPMAVVDPRLRVHGIGGIRVVDASVMPDIVSGNLNAAVMMIGEKAAAMIIEDARAG